MELIFLCITEGLGRVFFAIVNELNSGGGGTTVVTFVALRRLSRENPSD